MAAGLFGTTFQNRFTGLSDPLFTRLLGGSWAVWFYLWKLIWPFHLTIVYPRWEIHPENLVTWIPGMCFVAMLCLAWRARARWGRAVLFGLGYFLIALGPVLGTFKIVYFDFSRVADHLQYLAAPGFIAMVVAAGAHCLRTQARLVVAIVAVSALSILTWQHEEVYADMGSLWRQNLAENPDSFEALLYAGGEADRQHHYAEAENYFQRVLVMNPDSVEGTYNMAVLLDDEGRVDEAIASIEKTLRLRPQQADAHILLAWFLDEKNREDEAVAQLQEAIRLTPDDFRSYQNLGNILAKQGRLDEAIRQFDEALQRAPDNAVIYVGLGYAQGRKGDVAAAQKSFQEALRLDPGNAAAKNGLDATRK
jgi:tetratricopeptide (TPR) repeat protein